MDFGNRGEVRSPAMCTGGGGCERVDFPVTGICRLGVPVSQVCRFM